MEPGRAYLGTAELQHQSVGHELDVLLHELAVHPDQVDGQSLGQELLDPEQRGTGETGGTRQIAARDGSARPTCSISTAFLMMSVTVCVDGLFSRCLNIRQAKSQCRP